MKLKGIELKGKYKVTYYTKSFGIYDEKGNEIYFENSDGNWTKREYDKKGKRIYYENSDGFWGKSEYDEKGNQIYFETNSGYWAKKEYNEKGNMIYNENSDGFWEKCEYNKKGNMIYFENRCCIIIDERVKELTVEEIEKLLGYKIKIKGSKK